MTDRLRDDCFALPRGIDWTPVDVALGLLREGMRCVTGAQEVALAEGAGRILAAPVVARRSNPPAANSAIDGFAFAWASLKGAAEGDLALAEGRSAAGHPYPGTVAPGAAVRILTGAEIPAGADTVVLLEDSEVADGRVRFHAPRKQGANTQNAGEDAVAGPRCFLMGGG